MGRKLVGIRGHLTCRLRAEDGSAFRLRLGFSARIRPSFRLIP
jgi:hypothetical protein